MDVYERLKELGVELPKPAAPIGLYKPALQVGNFVYVSGQGNAQNGKFTHVGKVGAELSLEDGQASARVCAINTLAALEACIGDLNKIKRIVRTFGLVNCTEDFGQQPKVINGFSQLMADIWGQDDGIGVRCAVGTNVLPDNIATEIESIFELK